MRYLKNKISRASAYFLQKDRITNQYPRILEKKIKKCFHLEPRSPSNKFSNESVQKVNLALKNVAKNYGRAICHFILSATSDMYIDALIPDFSVTREEFNRYIAEKRPTLDGLEDFRRLLLVQNKDSEQTKQFKALFQKLSEIFIKYFSVNWIFHGKVSYKIEYLKVRNKMLRRVRNPEMFTYIK